MPEFCCTINSVVRFQMFFFESFGSGFFELNPSVKVHDNDVDLVAIVDCLS